MIGTIGIWLYVVAGLTVAVFAIKSTMKNNKKTYKVEVKSPQDVRDAINKVLDDKMGED